MASDRVPPESEEPFRRAIYVCPDCGRIGGAVSEVCGCSSLLTIVHVVDERVLFHAEREVYAMRSERDAAVKALRAWEEHEDDAALEANGMDHYGSLDPRGER